MARAAEQLLDAEEEEGLDPDGRRRRRERNRNAVVDALAALYRDGNLRPSSNEIAGRAGISPRSLFRYFDDVDDLCRAAVDRLQEQARPLLVLGATEHDPLPGRIDALVEQRIDLFRAVEPAATVSRLGAPFQPALADGLRRSRALLRSQLRELFRSELEGLGGGRAEQVVAAIDVLCSFESFELLRHDQDLSLARLRQTLACAITALLGAPHAGELRS